MFYLYIDAHFVRLCVDSGGLDGRSWYTVRVMIAVSWAITLLDVLLVILIVLYALVGIMRPLPRSGEMYLGI